MASSLCAQLHFSELQKEESYLDFESGISSSSEILTCFRLEPRVNGIFPCIMCVHQMGLEHTCSSFSADVTDTSNSDDSLSNQHNIVTNAVHEPTPYVENESGEKNDAVSRDVASRVIFRDDIVRNSSGLVGLVVEVAGDSDSDSSTSDDNSYDGNDDTGDNNVSTNDVSNGNSSGITSYNKRSPLPADHVRICWIDDTDTTQGIADVTVCDRGFLHGDFVAAASDPTGQVGVVVEVDLTVNLETSCGSVIENVASEHLKRVRELTIGDYVVCGPWLGRVDEIFDNVTVLFDDGSMCKVLRADRVNLMPVRRNKFEDLTFPYYPGQHVRASSSSVFKSSRWLCGSWKANRLEGIITKVTAGSAFIYWIACAGLGYGSHSYDSPPEEQNPKDLKLLSHFAYVNWQLGDRCLLSSPFPSSYNPNEEILEPEVQWSRNDEHEKDDASEPTSTDPDQSASMDVENEKGYADSKEVSPKSSNCSSVSLVSTENVRETLSLHRRKIRRVLIKRDKKSKRRREKIEEVLRIVDIKTNVSVMWQDEKIEHGLESKSLLPIENLGDHEFLPERYVMEKASDNSDDVFESRAVGIIASVNAKERTACVRWLRPVSSAEDPRVFDNEEVASVYELEGHPDYDYCYGDVVIRLSPISVDAQNSGLDENNENSAHMETKKEENTSAETSVDFSDLSWVGTITGLRNGDIEVTWADGMVSMVGPQAIYVVGRSDGESVADGGEGTDDAASWETVDDGDNDACKNDKEDDDKNAGRNVSLSFSQAAIGFFAKLASGIFSRKTNPTPPSSPDSVNESEREQEDTEAATTSNNDSCHDSSNVALEEQEGWSTTTSIVHPTEETVDSAMFCDDVILSFKKFDIVKDPLDHYFLGANAQSNAGKKWLKKVHKDWNILQNDLPEGIYVRVYEDRMDLLRAAVVGAYGTPYQNGLFFFDFHLPQEYPDVPLSAHYHSGGWRINPNLYEEGKVCLSLLNTWSGRGNEVWDPSSSSILQVLVSLQGLVLNSNPYFNEAGYDKQIGTPEGEKNSLSYNENTFLLNCKTMMYLMRRPPKDFEDLVKDHFRRRGYFILRACDAYAKGYLIGSLAKDAAVGEKSKGDATSVGFKLMLAKVAPKLFAALRDVGAHCDEFEHLQHA